MREEANIKKIGSTEAKACWCMREEEKNAQDWKIDEREWRMLV